MSETKITKSDLTAARIRVRQALDAYEAAWTRDAFTDEGAAVERAELHAAERAATELHARFNVQQRAL